MRLAHAALSLTGLVVAATALPGAAATAQQARTSCVTCHADADLFEPEQAAIVERFLTDDVHASVGLSCQSCHGGNPDPALFEEMGEAMDEEFAANPYRGAPERGEVPAFCGSCHSDPAAMRRYRPDIRVDQVAEYETSHHGRGLAAGDPDVATCVSCHGVHDIRRPTDPQSRVHPTRVADTCGECHSDAARMAGRTLAGGAPLPIDQAARWRQSVHAGALFDREDLSAPTCNDCHGNHGASPPGLDSVNFVCGQCHGREASLFRASDKRQLFEEHNEYLADAGEDGCAACHDLPEPQASVNLHELGECASCHGNHGIVRPTLAMLSPLPETPCYFCHEGAAAPVTEIHDIESGSHYAERRDQLLAEAERLGLRGDERFDWLVDAALGLSTHRDGGEVGGADPGPEFARLFEKFRIGKTSYAYVDPATGQPARAEVRRCGGCHAGEDLLEEDAVGWRTSATMLQQMAELTSRTAAAERALLRARRGGVETRAATNEIEQAVDLQIESEVLVHTFSVADGSQFQAKHAEGMEHASAAVAAAAAALDELASRRRGLVIALGLIGVALVGLALKIRDVSLRARNGVS